MISFGLRSYNFLNLNSFLKLCCTYLFTYRPLTLIFQSPCCPSNFKLFFSCSELTVYFRYDSEVSASSSDDENEEGGSGDEEKKKKKKKKKEKKEKKEKKRRAESADGESKPKKAKRSEVCFFKCIDGTI